VGPASYATHTTNIAADATNPVAPRGLTRSSRSGANDRNRGLDLYASRYDRRRFKEKFS
jgi:hypothetical protein